MKAFVIQFLILSTIFSCGKKTEQEKKFKTQSLNIKDSKLINSEDIDGDGINNYDDKDPFIANIEEFEFDLLDLEGRQIDTSLGVISNDFQLELIAHLRNKTSQLRDLPLGYNIPKKLHGKKFRIEFNNMNLSLQVLSRNLNLYYFENLSQHITIREIPKIMNDSFFIKINDFKMQETTYKKQLSQIKESCYEFIFINLNRTPFRVERVFISKALSLQEANKELEHYKLRGEDLINFNKSNLDFFPQEKQFTTLLNVDIPKFEYLPGKNQIIHITGKKKSLQKKINKNFQASKLTKDQDVEFNLGRTSFVKLTSNLFFEKQLSVIKEIKLKKTIIPIMSDSKKTVTCLAYQHKLIGKKKTKIDTVNNYLEFYLQGKKYTQEQLTKGIFLDNNFIKKLVIKVKKQPEQSLTSGFIPHPNKRKCGKKTFYFMEFKHNGRKHKMKHTVKKVINKLDLSLSAKLLIL